MPDQYTPRERGILFSAPMVKALLAGTKTQTRRAVKPQPVSGQGMVNAAYCGHPNLWLRDGHCDITDPAKEWRCPFGQVGDRLWVREAWKAHTTFDHLPPRDIPESHVWYMADDGYKAQSRYRHGMFMPRWASRITLEITDLRFERLQNISETDAKAEGICELPGQAAEPGCWWTAYVAAGAALHGRTPVNAYRLLWDQINGAGSWDGNPWVWCVEFSVLGTTTSKETADARDT